MSRTWKHWITVCYYSRYWLPPKLPNQLGIFSQFSSNWNTLENIGHPHNLEFSVSWVSIFPGSPHIPPAIPSLFLFMSASVFCFFHELLFCQEPFTCWYSLGFILNTLVSNLYPLPDLIDFLGFMLFCMLVILLLSLQLNSNIQSLPHTSTYKFQRHLKAHHGSPGPPFPATCPLFYVPCFCWWLHPVT